MESFNIRAMKFALNYAKNKFEALYSQTCCISSHLRFKKYKGIQTAVLM